MFAAKVLNAPWNGADDSLGRQVPRRSPLGDRRDGDRRDPATLEAVRGNPLGAVVTGRRWLIAALSGLATAAPTSSSTAGAACDFSQIPLYAPHPDGQRPQVLRSAQTGGVQPKLAIGSVDDPLEHEADAVADRVLTIADPAPSISSAAEQVSRTCAGCENEQVSRTCAGCENEQNDEENKLRRKPTATERQVGDSPPTVGALLRSPGEPLDPSSRAYFEPRFGYDFSAIRMYRGAMAAQSARDVGALAYTVGHNIVVGDAFHGFSDRNTQRLLAHELTHVIQQGGARPASSPPVHTPPMGWPGRSVGRAATAIPDGIGHAGGVAVQRQATPAPSEDFVECDPALQSDLRARHPVALAHVGAAIATLDPGWDRMAPENKALFQRYFDPSGTGDVDNSFVGDVRNNFVQIRSYMQNLTFDCDPKAGSLCGNSQKWCVQGRLMWTCFGNLHVCLDAYRNTSNESFKTETMIHESVHNALHTTDRAYENKSEFQKLHPRPGGILGFLAKIPVLGALFRPLVKLLGAGDTLYNPDSYARYAMEAGRTSS